MPPRWPIFGVSESGSKERALEPQTEVRGPILDLRKTAHALKWACDHRTGRMSVAEAKFILPCLGPADVSFDVGAHGGAWCALLSKASPLGRIFAFEALPYYAEVLTLTSKLCGWKSVEIINRAVGDDAKPVSLMWKDSSGERLTGRTHVSGIGDHDGATVAVGGVSLDGFRESRRIEHVRFIKIDVEGFELPVLRGAVKTVEECRPLFWCELWAEYTQRYGYTPADVFQFFLDRGYRTFIIDVDRGLIETDVAAYPGQRDILAVPAEWGWRGGA